MTIVAGTSSARGELDKSNMLMTPQELERMPDQGLEFEQSVGPKESPKALPPPSAIVTAETNSAETTGVALSSSQLFEEHMTHLATSADAPIVLSGKGDKLTAITVLTRAGTKVSWADSPSVEQLTPHIYKYICKCYCVYQ